MKPSGLAGEFAEPFAEDTGEIAETLGRQFARTPYAVSFLSAGKTFILVTLHVVYRRRLRQRAGCNGKLLRALILLFLKPVALV